jgi:hypothetical protein
MYSAVGSCQGFQAGSLPAVDGLRSFAKGAVPVDLEPVSPSVVLNSISSTGSCALC